MQEGAQARSPQGDAGVILRRRGASARAAPPAGEGPVVVCFDGICGLPACPSSVHAAVPTSPFPYVLRFSSWVARGSLLGPRGASLGHLGSCGPLGLLEASWALGVSWAPPGAILEAIDQKRGWFFFRPPVGAFKWASWGSLGALLGRSWALQDPRAPKSARDPAARDPPRDPPARGADAGLEGWRHDRSYSDEGVNPSPKGRRAEGEEGGWKRNLSKL